MLALLLLAAAPQDRTLHEGLLPHPLGDRGLELSASLILDAFGVASGGVERGFEPLALAGVMLSADLEELLGLEGWTSDVHGLYAMDGGLDAAVGTVQGISNAEAPDLDLFLFEAWAQGPLSSDVELQLGKLDVNGHFAETLGGGDFIGSPFGASPLEASFPTYPDTSFGARLGWQADDRTLLQVGWFDGSTLEGRRTATHGPGPWLEGRAPSFLIAEVSRASDDALTLTSLGAWYSTADVDELDGGVSSGTAGGYLTVDRSFVGADGRRVDGFVQLGLADPDIGGFEVHAAGGVVLHGLLDERPGDTLGLGVSWVGGAEADALASDAELLVEVHWRAAVDEHLVLQPAALALLNPAGDPDAEDALVLGIRALLSW